MNNQYIPEPKKTWEVFGVFMGFGNNMDDGESIDVSQSAVTIEKKNTGEDVTSDLISGEIFAPDSTSLGAVLTGGTSGTKYTARFKAYISDNKKLEESLIFVVRD